MPETIQLLVHGRRIGGILDIGDVVDSVKEILEDAKRQGYVEIRIMLPSKVAGETPTAG
jgi:hypothetical protein